MTDELPKWPDSLPPPIEFVEGPQRVFLSSEDLNGQRTLTDLVHDLYWFPDSEYFLYFEHGAGIGHELNARLEECGVEMRKTELYFYRHPRPAYTSDFIRVLPGATIPDWQRESAQGQMFGRVSLTLNSAARKQMDHAELARATSTAMADNESVIEAKPNFFGLGINLNSVWHRVKKRLGWSKNV